MRSGERKNTLMVMLTDEEKAIIKSKAKELGMTMSSYARFATMLDAGRGGDRRKSVCCEEASKDDGA